jgi:chromosome segregation ATPase
MNLKDMNALLQKSKKPEEKKPAEKKAEPGEVLPLLGGDESLNSQPQVAKEEFPISAPEVSDVPVMEQETDEQPSEPQKEKSPIEKIAATITENVERVMNEALSQIEETIGGLAEALETHTRTTNEKISLMEESTGNIATKTREIEGVANELEGRVDAAAALITDMKGTRDMLEGRVDQAQAATQNMQENVAKLGNDMANLTEKADSIEASLDARFNSVGEWMDSLDTRIDETKGEADSLSKKMADLEKDANMIHNYLDKSKPEFENKLKTLEKKFVDKLREILGGFQKDVNAINKRIGAMQKEIDGAGQQAKDAESKADSANAKTDTLEVAMNEKLDTVGELMASLDGKIDGAQEEASTSLGKLEKRVGIVETDAGEQRAALEDFLRKDLGRSKLLGDILDTIIEELLVEALKAEDYQDYNHEGPPMDEKELLRALSKDPEYVRAKLAKKFFGDLEAEELKKRLNEPRNAERKKWVDYTAKLIITRAQEMCQR